MIPGANTLNNSKKGYASLSRVQDLWLLFLIAGLGVIINGVYLVVQLFSGDPFNHFSAHLSGNIFIMSLLVVFPAVSYLIYRTITRHELIRSSKLLEVEVATRTRELEELKDFTESVMASVNDLIFVIGSDGRFHFVRGNSSMLGCDKDRLIGHQLIDMVAPGSVTDAVDNFERILRGEEVSPYEIEIITCDRETRCIEISSTGYLEDGAVRAQVGVARDVTERRKLEQHVLKRNRELSSLNSIAASVGKSLELEDVLAAALNQIAILLNSDRSWVHVHNEREGLLELKVWRGRGSPVTDELGVVSVGQGVIGEAAEREAPVAVDIDAVTELAEAAQQDGEIACLAVAPMKFRGRLVGVLTVSSEEPDHFSSEDLDLMRLASSQVAMAVENALLYEDLKHKSLELERRNAELAMSSDKISNLIFEAEREQSFSVRYENQSLVRCWEVKKCSQRECPSYGSEDLRCWQVAGTHCGGVVQGVFAQKIGQCEKCEVFQEARSDHIASMGEAFNNMMAILERKVEEQRELQDQLTHSTKLAVIGELAANVAHEINNPLTGILGYASILLKQLPEDDPNRKKLAVIEKETLRARDIVRNLLDFSRRNNSHKEDTALDKVLDDTLGLLRKQAELANVEVSQKLDVAPASVYADPNKLKQVFINIINNAIFAMPEGGRLTVSLRSISPIGDNGRVEVSFKDTGIGIAPEKLGQVFEPFYTSKEAGEGTGLGLSVSKRIVEEHGGAIEVKSTVGAGSTFTVVLPTKQSDVKEDQRVA